MEPKKAKQFQIRWNEPLGKEGSPYAYRWVLIFFGYSIRVHKWICSDGGTESGEKHFHNHPWWFYTFVLKGGYTDVIQNGESINFVKLNCFELKYRPANHLHYVVPNSGGCWSLLFTGRPKSKWGFWVNNRILRPLKYFHKFGTNAPCKL